MPRTVILLHTLPDGAGHYDWLIARDGDDAGADAGPLIAFRTNERIDHASPGAAAPLERLDDHRPLYLSYEGPISAGRGEVARIAEGVCRLIQESDDRIVVEADFGAGPLTWTCTPNPDAGPRTRWQGLST